MEKHIAAVIRYTPSAGWYVQNDADHAPLGVSSVGIVGDSLRVNFNFVATKVGALVMVPDDALIAEGYGVAGAGVGLTAADFKFSRTFDICGQVSFDGTSWLASYAAPHSPVSLEPIGPGHVRVHHKNVWPDVLPPQLTRRVGGNECCIGVFGASFFDIHFSNTANPAGFTALFKRAGYTVPPVSDGYGNSDGNFFLHGIMTI